MTFVKHLLLGVLLFAAFTAAQVRLGGNMAVNAISLPSLYDYLNTNYATAAAQNGTFGSAVSFSGQLTVPIGEWEAGIDAAYVTDSYNYPSLAGQYALDYGITSLCLLGYKVFTGNGYFFRVGGGAGPAFASFSEVRPPSLAGTTYTSVGFAVLAAADANTALGANTFATIGCALRYFSCGTPKSGAAVLPVNFNKDALRVAGVSAGLSLGVVYVW